MTLEEASSIHVIAVLYYRNYLTNLANSIAKLSQFAKPDEITVVMNNPDVDTLLVERSMQSLASRVQCIRHDNTGGEFGAYQLGIDHVRNNLQAQDCLIIINETLGIHYPFEREHAAGFMRTLLDRNNARRIVGHIDHFARRVRIDDYQTSRWVRSNLVGLDRGALGSIDDRIYEPHLHDYIHETDVVGDFFSDKVDHVLQAYIADWLFSEGRWYGAAALSSGNVKSLAFKARSILQEKYLSMRLEQHQVAFLGPTYRPLEQITRRAKNGLGRVSRALRLRKAPVRA